MFVRFVDKYKPVYAPDDDLGAGTNTDTEIVETGDDTPAEQPEGPGSGRSALRKSLEKGFENDRKASAAAERGAKRGASRVGDRIGAGVAPAGTEEAPEIEESVEPEAEATPKVAAPEAFSKEAKAEWAKVPSAVQAAVLKRETDVAKGVDELKGRYRDIDQALSPHMNAIRQHGHTPAQAVNQLFAWFQALGQNPDAAFPALAKSFNWDVAKLQAQAQPAAAAPAAGTEQPAEQVSPAMQQYINDMRQEVERMKQTFGQELTGLKSTFQQQSEAKTNEILANWSRDKAHFEKARIPMAQLIQSGAVPLKDGQVDLDAAYDMAIYAMPELRNIVLAEKEAAAVKARADKAAALKKKQEEAVANARRAGTSLGGGAPGAEGTQPAGRKGKGLSVRESINAAREELSS